MIAWLLAGCAQPIPSDTSFLKIRGSVSKDVVVNGDDAGAMLVWVTSVDGQTCVEADPLVFVPSLFAYEADVAGPPSLDGHTCVPATVADGPFAVGLLALVDPPKSEEVEVTADPLSLLGWFAGEPTSLSDILVADEGAVAAVAKGAVFIVVGDGVTIDPIYARFDAAIPGLTLYADRGMGSGGWDPLADPGVRTEFQGVDLDVP